MMPLSNSSPLISSAGAHLLLSFVLATSLLTSTTTSTTFAQETPNDFGIFEWIHKSDGGYFNPKQEFRYEIPGDSSTAAGVFATQDISEGEILVQIPWYRVLKSDDETEEGPMCCGTVQAVAREMRLGADSDYAPYAQYLNAQPEGQIPSAWSTEGQNLLKEVVGGESVTDTEIPPEEPSQWLEWDWYKDCNGDPSDKLSAKAALLVVQRSDDAIMIPAYDMYNHRNGERWMNTKTTIEKEENHVTVAFRDIKAGEQIYISYNHCHECGARDESYGTAEILRDYGFVENFPQEWWFGDYQFIIDEDPSRDGELTFEWVDDMKPKEDDEYEKFKVFLSRQRLRLHRIRNMSKFNSRHKEIPQNELQKIWSFVDSYIVGMNLAISSMETRDQSDETDGDAENNRDEGGDVTEERCSNNSGPVNGSHYDTLAHEIDDNGYDTGCCDNQDILDWGDMATTEALKTNYQQLNFAVNREDDDVCMDIEDIVQICTSYRPQYHEYVVHAAARHVDTVKRVIFIGGGDSMILHEVLKYPSLELVVGLELDQMVVRKSFKHFKTQPHFDDDRVEWWFGDATKSLLLLEKDYWQSFDLVLVDLSETVMSLSVNDELDVFDALRLLLKPDGVMVKNEKYFAKMSELFDYTTQIYYESPIICSQTVAMGSNSANFFTHMPKDHQVETLLYEPLTKKDNHLDFMHDFRKNDARKQGKCELNITATPSEQQTAAGIISVVEAEKSSVALDDGAALAKSIHAVVDALGFNFLLRPFFSNGSVYGVMKEGYVVARLWPDKKYCAFDINLWGRFDKLKSLESALVEVVGSTLVSSYRVVVGGMFGSSTWAEDQAIVGPQIIQPRNCEDPPVPTDATTTTKGMVEVALQESTILATKSKLKTLVVCGVEGKSECNAAELFTEHDDIKSLNKIYTCSGLDDEEVSEEVMYECEFKTLVNLLSLVNDDVKSKIDLLFVDASVPYPMIQVLHSILGTIRDRLALFKMRNTFIVLSTNPETEEWRFEFLDRYRKQYEEDPVGNARISLTSGKSNVGVGVVGCGDEDFIYNLEIYMSKLQSVFGSHDKDVVVDLLSLIGGDFPYLDEWDPPQFAETDYDMAPALAQYAEQEFLGRQNIFQLVPSEDVDDLEMSSKKLKEGIERGMELMKVQVQSHHEITDVGEGCVHMFLCDEGSIIGVWDGRNHIDLNVFTYDEMPGGPKDFIGEFIESMEGKLMLALRDDQPRGVGRVVNFPGDMAADSADTSEKSEL